MSNFTVGTYFWVVCLFSLVILVGSIVVLIIGLVKKNKLLTILGVGLIVVVPSLALLFIPLNEILLRTSSQFISEKTNPFKILFNGTKLNTSFGSFSKNTATSSEGGVYYQSFPVTCIDKDGGVPAITGLSSSFTSDGTKLEVVGCNFAGLEGEKMAKIKNNMGVIGFVQGEEGSTNKLLKLTLKTPLCQEDNAASGLPCKETLILKTGIYEVSATAWGKDSKGMSFLIQ